MRQRMKMDFYVIIDVEIWTGLLLQIKPHKLALFLLKNCPLPAILCDSAQEEG